METLRISGDSTGLLRLSVTAGEVIHNQGDAATHLFFIEAGIVKICFLGAGKEVVIGLRRQGDFIGVQSLIGRVHGSTAIALSETVLVGVTKSAVSRLLRDGSEFSGTVVDYLARQHARDQENLIELMTRPI
jgi:CRP-like cAMP-binding protein